MSFNGELPHFYGQNDEWEVFRDRVEEYAVLNDLNDVKTRAVLITCIDHETHKQLVDLCYPELPKNKTFKEICELLNKHFKRRPCTYRERHIFYNAKQEESEAIIEWFKRIRSLAVDCNLGYQFSGILLDRFISGLRESSVLEQIYRESTESMTLQRALEITIEKPIV